MKRTTTLLVVWLTGAVAAVGLGLLAVSLVGGSASPSATNAGFLATDSSGPAAPTAAPDAASGTQQTAAGTVYASCSAGEPALAAAPAAGWQVDDSREQDRVEFHNGNSTVEVRADCSSGSPQFSVDGPRARVDGGHGGDSGDGHDSGGQGDDG